MGMRYEVTIAYEGRARFLVEMGEDIETVRDLTDWVETHAHDLVSEGRCFDHTISKYRAVHTGVAPSVSDEAVTASWPEIPEEGDA